jgi:hypothetical protein
MVGKQSRLTGESKEHSEGRGLQDSEVLITIGLLER